MGIFNQHSDNQPQQRFLRGIQVHLVLDSLSQEMEIMIWSIKNLKMLVKVLKAQML